MAVIQSSGVSPLSAVAAVLLRITIQIRRRVAAAQVVALRAVADLMAALLVPAQRGKEILVALLAAPGSLAVAVVPAALAPIILEQVVRGSNTRLRVPRSTLLVAVADRATPELAVMEALVAVAVAL